MLSAPGRFGRGRLAPRSGGLLPAYDTADSTGMGCAICDSAAAMALSRPVGGVLVLHCRLRGRVP